MFSRRVRTVLGSTHPHIIGVNENMPTNASMALYVSFTPIFFILSIIRVREDHLKSDLDQRSRSDKWSRSFYPKDHLKRKDQDLDQDHPKRSLSCTKDGDIYSAISHILSHWWVLKSIFQIMLKRHLFINCYSTQTRAQRALFLVY